MGAWTPWLAGGTVAASVVLGWCLALLTLPGVWVMLAAAALVNWLWTPGIYSWWTLSVCAGVALVGELLEVVASGVGAKKFGGSGWGATGAVVGSLLGALLGTLVIPIPVIGTIIGSVLGASGGALMTERWVKGRSWEESNKAAAGAAVGRLVATAIKLGVAVAVGLVLLAGLVTPL
ncbi:MAG TPA: DUF456 domain-containing protein [Phycisphaerales bacterium]|nr:DUF456 domain-containing protein [Phycisphaerales bacterium]